MEQTYDERCSHKGKYSKKTALTVKNIRMKEGEKFLREYNCPLCGSWHLTHKDKRGKSFVKNTIPYKRERQINFLED